MIANGHLFLAQPPLYRAKRGQSETYLKDDKAMERIKQLRPGGWGGRMTGADVTVEAPTGAASECACWIRVFTPKYRD